MYKKSNENSIAKNRLHDELESKLYWAFMAGILYEFSCGIS